VTGDVYIADRSNAAVDIFSGTSLSLIGRATGFTGQQATTSVSGPDGVVTVTSGGVTTLYAGDGNSTLRVYNTTNPASPAFVSAISTNPANTPPVTRVDEMAYSPATGQVLAANNAATPAFGNLFSTTGGHPPVALTITPITVPAVQGGIDAGGLEQSVWVPDASKPGGGSFYISVPALNPLTNPGGGGVSEISTTGVVLRTIDLGALGITSCSPTGLALGASGNLMVGCGNANTQAVLLNPAGAGSIVNKFTQISGTDEIWYDPNTGDYYVTGANAAGQRVFDVISDATDSIVQSVLLPVSNASNPHSIAVDESNGDVFVPLAGTTFNTDGTVNVANTFCPLGCIAVFAVPEPGSLPLLVGGLAGLIGLAVRRRVHSG
jgi:hypothetical protein